MSSEFQLTTLSNGLRVATVPIEGAKITAVGTWVGVGSRYEEKAQNGISHFLEHMLFKGTKNRKARQIWHDIESLGGELNAETDREQTAYYAKVLGGNLAQGFNVVADLLRNSTFPRAELARERLVVIEEIKEYIDNVSEHLADCFMEKCFAGQALGRPILGSPRVIGALSRQDLMEYKARHYTPERMVVVAAGKVDHRQLLDLARTAYGDMKPSPQIIRPFPATYIGDDVRIERDMQQIEMHVAFQGVGTSHADYPAHRLLAQIIGGGNASPLFQKIRAARGLVYDVSPLHWNYTDAGVFGVSAGLNARRVPEYLDVLTKTLRTSVTRVTEQDLQQARNVVNAENAFYLEGAYERAAWAATCLLNGNDAPAAQGDQPAKINAVTREDLKRVHAEIFSTKPMLAAIGDIRHLENYDTFAARFSSFRPAKTLSERQPRKPAL